MTELANDGTTSEKTSDKPAGSWPISTAAITGLGWGLAFGLIDALPALLEGDTAQDLGRRLLTLAYVALFDALVFCSALTLVGVAVWLLLRVTRLRAGRAGILALYLGFCAAISAMAYLLQRYGTPSLPLVLVAGIAVGLLTSWLALAATSLGGDARQAWSPSLGRRPSSLIVATVASMILLMLGVALFRATARDWSILNPRVTDQVATPERPNIVLISIDALRADRIGAYGNDQVTSPNIDALAQRGLIFRQAIAQASSTVPAVASFMTSLHPTELGIIPGRIWGVDEARVTLAEALQVGGYRTQAYVTNGHLVEAKGYAQGFDRYTPPEPDRPYGIDRLRVETILPALACRYSSPLCGLFDKGHAMLFDRLLVMENEGGRVNARARRFIRVHGGEQFFLWLHYMEPHAKYRPVQAVGQWPDAISPGREEYLRAWQPANAKSAMVMREDDLVALQGLYQGEQLDVDRWIGDIWEEIEAQGLADRTLLVITADHGEEFADHGEFGHGHTAYQDLTWVPLIFVGPTVASPGRTVDMPVPMLDLLPTLVDIADAPLPEPVRGQSLAPVLEGGEPYARPIVIEAASQRSAYVDKALRQGDYKLVYNVTLDQVELYDLHADPGEQVDLSLTDPQRAAQMRDQLRHWTAAAVETWASLPQSGGQPQELDAAMQEALQQIGY